MNQRFELVTSDGTAAPATVPLLLSGPTPAKASLIWLSNDEDNADADASAAAKRKPAAAATAPAAHAAKRPRVE